MKMDAIIGKVSELYREKGKLVELKEELLSVSRKLMEAEYTKYNNISVADFRRLERRKKELQTKIALEERYYDGIFDTRELLMKLGFDTEVE